MSKARNRRTNNRREEDSASPEETHGSFLLGDLYINQETYKKFLADVSEEVVKKLAGTYPIKPDPTPQNPHDFDYEKLKIYFKNEILPKILGGLAANDRHNSGPKIDIDEIKNYVDAKVNALGNAICTEIRKLRPATNADNTKTIKEEGWPNNPREYVAKLKERYPKGIKFFKTFFTDYNSREFECAQNLREILSYPSEAVVDQIYSFMDELVGKRREYAESFCHQCRDVFESLQGNEEKIGQYLTNLMTITGDINKRLRHAKNTVL